MKADRKAAEEELKELLRLARRKNAELCEGERTYT